MECAPGKSRQRKMRRPILAEALLSYPEDYEEIVRTQGVAKFPYRPTHSFDGDFINSQHKALFNTALQPGKPIIDHEIEGWLRREDAAKLYEMAYFCGGDIVELGTSRGLSAFIMASAIKDAKMSGAIYTTDLLEDRCTAATKRLKSRGVDNVFVLCDEGEAFLRRWADQGKKFTFAFIDHAHDYDPVKRACVVLADVLVPGSFVAFHDFCDSRNFDEGTNNFGVFQGVEDGIDASFRFYGAFGCMSLYRYEP